MFGSDEWLPPFGKDAQRADRRMIGEVSGQSLLVQDGSGFWRGSNRNARPELREQLDMAGAGAP